MTRSIKISIGRIGAVWLLVAGLSFAGYGQHIQDRVISLSVRGMPLAQVLDSIGKRGHFEFSYNSSILRGDSLVTLNLHGETVGSALAELLGKGYVYAEQGNYLIILRTPAEQVGVDRTYQLTGYVTDRRTGQGIGNATVYVKEQLQSTLTDAQGYFRLRLRVRSPLPVLSVSKEWYADTDIVIHAGYDQAVRIPLTEIDGTSLSPVYISFSGIERTWWGRRFLSTRQRIQSLNLAHFFTSSTSQVSLVPWVGTHGKLSGQVTNDLSLNIIGGYSAGARGLELGGVFNIDKKDVHGVQMGGVLNLVGGNFRGLQVSGLMNYVEGSMRGLQLAGYISVVKGNVNGVQLSGLSNRCKDTLRGVQAAVLKNTARRMEGVQIGLINVADSSTGYQIGLISIVKHGGVHQLSVSTSALTGLTLEYRMGGQKLNSILLAGYNPWSSQKLLSWGYGIGKDFPLTKRWGLYGEMTLQDVYNHQLETLGVIGSAKPLLTFRLDKKMQIFAGPAFSFYNNLFKPKADSHWVGELPHPGILNTSWGQSTSAWVGFSIGITFF